GGRGGVQGVGLGGSVAVVAVSGDGAGSAGQRVLGLGGLVTERVEHPRRPVRASGNLVTNGGTTIRGGVGRAGIGGGPRLGQAAEAVIAEALRFLLSGTPGGGPGVGLAGELPEGVIGVVGVIHGRGRTRRRGRGHQRVGERAG